MCNVVRAVRPQICPTKRSRPPTPTQLLLIRRVSGTNHAMAYMDHGAMYSHAATPQNVRRFHSPASCTVLAEPMVPMRQLSAAAAQVQAHKISMHGFHQPLRCGGRDLHAFLLCALKYQVVPGAAERDQRCWQIGERHTSRYMPWGTLFRHTCPAACVPPTQRHNDSRQAAAIGVRLRPRPARTNAETTAA
jgi:hypothetical protein